MKTAVIYARYSCDNQTEQSIEGQLNVCQDYAKRNDILILDTYVDRAMTGTNDNRPAFQKMLKDSAGREWDYILVYKLDRFSRNKYETAIHKKTLRDNGVKVLSAMENIPDTPEGIILESLLEGMNQYYSAELAQKVRRGMRETRRKGFELRSHCRPPVRTETIIPRRDGFFNLASRKKPQIVLFFPAGAFFRWDRACEDRKRRKRKGNLFIRAGRGNKRYCGIFSPYLETFFVFDE